MSTQDKAGSTYDFSSDSEDELDWEEVAVPQAQHLELEEDQEAGPSTRPNIEVTLEAYPSPRKGSAQKKPPGGISHAERLLRIDCHKVHTVALIVNASVRNRWINDELLQARLLSLTPLAIQNSFAMIHKSRIPDDVKRGFLFEQAVSRLASWWAFTFFTINPTGHLRSRTFEDVQRVLHSKGLVDISGKGKGKAFPQDVDSREDLFDDNEVELVRSAKSLMKHALMRSGSRDVSSQLFTALCRALGIPARLVVSLQSVPWQTNVGRSKTLAKQKRSKSKGKAVELRDSEDNSEGMQLANDLRQNGCISGDDMQVICCKAAEEQEFWAEVGFPGPPRRSDPLTTPPVFWTEVFSRPDGRWLPVDPIRAIVNKRKVFDPTPVGTSSRVAIADNRMIYVIAVEEDGYMRDVTPRYAKQYSAKVSKAQSGGRGRRDWWTQVTQMVTRPYKLHRDDIEDDELIVNQFTEGMPTTIGGFKDHPFYVLERHLLRDQIISSDAHELGKFRGEPVYSRSQVLHLKAAENWMRRGRIVRAGEQPLKYVKQRAVTVNRRRELEIRADAEGANGSGDVMQGLYSEAQTERYIPPPVIDGKIPKNNFGNIDLYTPSMLPAGATHIPHKGVAKIARQLGFDHAEAVTSFEFKKGKAFPVISGIVVATENEDIILEASCAVKAYWEAEHAVAQKEQEKRQQAVLKRWAKLIQGLRIRQRMREQYGSGADVRRNKTSGGGDIKSSTSTARDDDKDGIQPATVGGFLSGVEDVVQPYSLPQPLHAVFSSPPPSPNPSERASPISISLTASPVPASPTTRGNPLPSDDGGEDGVQAPHPFLSDGDPGLDTDNPDTAGGNQHVRRMMPKSMAALAAEAAQAQAAANVATPQMSGVEAPSASAPLRATRSMPKRKTETKPRTPEETRRKKRARVRNDDDDLPRGSGSDPDLVVGSRVTKRSRQQRLRGDANADPSADEADLVPRSDRVLRTRKGKSPEQLAREHQQELAVKRALAGG
ncbi:hypothetical protein BC826DRAFT_1107975 [Russula brevipes]|nr:hypothetical protein BC826DRAFT_1107975 [Russula brevipes]